MGDMVGRIVKGVGGDYTVDMGDEVYTCEARGLFRLKKQSPLVGDMVKIDIIDKAKRTGYLMELLPRKNEILRPKVANVDMVLLVCAIVPVINYAVLDALLIALEKQNQQIDNKVKIIICMNKADIDEAAADKALAGYRAAGYTCLALSAMTNKGVERLKGCIEGVAILSGPSGVGKSSLLNALSPNLQLATGGLSERVQRGKHTTRHASLLKLDNGSFVADTPGFSAFNIDNIPKGELARYYPEFAALDHECYYNDCLHVSEHDCAVKANVGKSIDFERYNRYVEYIKRR